MCEVSEKIMEQGRKIGEEQGRKIGRGEKSPLYRFESFADGADARADRQCGR